MVTTRSTAIAIAHDLKTPLSRAHLSLQTAFSRIDDGQDPRDALEKTEAELERLNRIFDTILRISRIETAPQDAEFRSFALPPLLIDLAETFAPMAEEDGQSLKLSLPGTPVSAVFGDERMVRQMIVNLIQNAMRHGTAGNLITIELQQADGRCIVDIADHGPGIPQDERARVFEAFYRLDSSRSGGGGGLGLALVKAIAQRHDIAIDLADNAPGLRVRLTFPPARPVSPASELVG
jgi:signal transduction histidine kinase